MFQVDWAKKKKSRNRSLEREKNNIYYLLALIDQEVSDIIV